MTEAQVKRANELIYARDELEEFLSARDPQSEFVRSYVESKHEYRRDDGKRLQRAKVVALYISDTGSCRSAAEGDHETVGSWHLPRDVVERAFEFALKDVRHELAELGVTAE